ncbi:nitroreductase [Desulfonema ishimotonii]|uniref:Nitroreductase n=1 Tax=Desulfonema ishimotonii TaxID=45657 RepID=A0A401FUF2_9BACT|nr:nitroreductase family protein [Desulfonema ishimotonii]GBC60585.1 nitroreductase [Desulfonema ishimotonii]
MALISIDAEKCKKDGICIRECPFNILRANEENIPEMIPGAEAVCLRCGHCLAVCPTGAVTFDGISPEACEPAADAGISVSAIARLVKNRRSVRVYKNKPVPRDIVEKMMDIVRWAPTAKNVQPVHWTLVDDREKIHKMAGMVIEWLRQNKVFPEIVAAWDGGEDIILRDAPLLAIAHTGADGLNPPADCAIAATTLELVASGLGIGGCWAGYFMRGANSFEPLKQYLNLPEGHRVYTALMLGYPKFKYHRIPPRQDAKLSWM